jgi:hypothetical protein
MADVLASRSPTLSPRSSFHSVRRSASRSLLHSSTTASASATASSSNTTPSAPNTTFSTDRAPSHRHASISRPPSPAMPLPQQTPARLNHSSSIRATVDTGTQYTPEGYPPTALSSSAAAAVAVPSTALVMSSTSNNASADGAPVASGGEQMDTTTDTSPIASSPTPPPAPKVQQDPEPHRSPTTAAEEAARAESPTKRAKSQPGVIIMPRNYMDGDVRDLGVIISHMLMELIRINDRLPFDPERLTRFHSRYVILSISLRSILQGRLHALSRDIATLRLAACVACRNLN